MDITHDLYYVETQRQACHLLACWFFAEFISSTLKIKAMCSSEKSVETQRTTLRHIPEDDTLHYHSCENLKSYLLFFVVCERKDPEFQLQAPCSPCTATRNGSCNYRKGFIMISSQWASTLT
jgi:hypothetical protein